MTLRPSLARVVGLVVFAVGFGAWAVVDPGDRPWFVVIGALSVLLGLGFAIKMALLRIEVSEEDLVVTTGRQRLRFGPGDDLLHHEFSLPLTRPSRWLHLASQDGKRCTVVLDFFAPAVRDQVVSHAKRVKALQS